MLQGLGRRIRRFALLGLALHTLFVAAAPFEHHDLICHLKTPQHCTSCTSSPVGSGAQLHTAPGTAVLHDAGAATAAHPTSESTLLTASNSGRSPPAAA
jgi:hypothetical protein